MLELQSLEENMTNEDEEGPELVTPKIKMGSNDVNNTPRIGSAQYVCQKEKRYR